MSRTRRSVTFAHRVARQVCQDRYDVIQRPLITEKSNLAREEQKEVLPMQRRIYWNILLAALALLALPTALLHAETGDLTG